MNYTISGSMAKNAVQKVNRVYPKNTKERHAMKQQKPGFIKRWLHKNIQEIISQINSEPEALQLVSRDHPSHVSSIDQPERALHFTVYIANGGRVVETRKYDRIKDRHHNGLYIINNDQDFGREIDKIITMESLKS